MANSRNEINHAHETLDYLDPNYVEKDTPNWTALHRAVYEGNVERVKELISKNAKVTKDANGDFPCRLINEALRNDADYQKRRLACEKLANPNYVDVPHYRQTALHFAVRAGDVERVKWLVENDVEVIKDDYGHYPHYLIIEALRNDAGYQKRRLACEKLANPNYIEKDHPQWTSLHRAMYEGNIKRVKWLLANGAEPKQDANGDYPHQISSHLSVGAATRSKIEALIIARLSAHPQAKEFSLDMPVGKGKLTVNYNAANGKALVTCSLPSMPVFSYQVKESASGNHSFKDFQEVSGRNNNLTVFVSKNLIDQEMHAMQHIPASERKEAAMVSISAKSIRDFQESFSQPERLVNATIKDNNHAIAVGDQLVKSDIKIAYNQNMLATKTSSTHWGFSMVCDAHSSGSAPEKSKAIASILEMADSVLSCLKPLSLVGLKIPCGKQASVAVDYEKRVLAAEEESGVKFLCAGLGSATKFLGSSIATGIARCASGAVAELVPVTAGLSLFAIPVIGFAWQEALRGVAKAGNAVQYGCETVFKEPKEEKPEEVNKDKTFILGTKIQLGINTFFPFSPVVQAISLLHNQTPKPPLTSMSSTAVVSAKLAAAPVIKPCASRQLSPEQSASLAKEKTQTVLYYQTKTAPKNASASQKAASTPRYSKEKAQTAHYYQTKAKVKVKTKIAQKPARASQRQVARSRVAQPTYNNPVICNGMTVFAGGGAVSTESRDYFGGGFDRSDNDRQSYDSCGRMR